MLDSASDTVLSRYHGKTVICFDYDVFPFCDTDKRVIEFVDPAHAMPVSQSGTRFLFVTNPFSGHQETRKDRLLALALSPALDNIDTPIRKEHEFPRSKGLCTTFSKKAILATHACNVIFGFC